jgi:hypothetical protein
MPGFFAQHWERFTGLDPSGSRTAGGTLSFPEVTGTSGDMWRGASAGWRESLKGQGYAESVLRGGASAVWGVSPLPEGPADAWDAWIGGADKKGVTGIGKAARGLVSKIPRGVRAIAQTAGRAAFRWAGPVITTGRLATETRGRGVAGGINKGIRILGEETLGTAAFFAGMPIGAAIGGAIGGTLGSVAPGVGNAIGFVAGAAIGTAFSAAAGWGWNRAVDVAELPFRIAGAGYDFMRDLGKRSTRPELGGRVSAANRTRAAHTMRQRHLMAMSRSGVNERSLLGREANLQHIRSMT